MKKYPLLEICVETLEMAVAAEQGGADRIELCENLLEGGVTPCRDLMRSVRAQVHFPVFAMVRPRGGDFFYSTREYIVMIRAIAMAKDDGMDGVVLGVLHADQRIDIKRTRELIDMARPLPVTFHRAFDETTNLLQALENVIATGAARILTAGGKTSAVEGSSPIAELVEAARNRIGILPGGGISGANIECLLQRTRAREFHSGLSTVLPYPQTNPAAFEAEVRRLAEALRKHLIQ